jgi:hypothetical protein
MADKEVLTGDDEELIPVETPPEETPDEPPDEEEGEQEDERLGASEDDEDEEPSATKKRRQKRREYARQKRDEAKAELEFLRTQNSQLLQRVAAVETHALSTNEQAILTRYQQAQADVVQAEEIFARATSEGQGEYALQAIRIRDAARAEADRLAQLHQQTQQQREQQVAQAQAAPHQEAVARHANAWTADNPWYDPDGKDEVSQLTKRIDVEIAQAGYNPAQRVYWEELTRRVSAALSPAGGKEPATRNAPPMGTTREHAPPSTRRNEFYVTPERKAAMIEAGKWDDPVVRNRVLKEYREYDKASAR